MLRVVRIVLALVVVSLVIGATIYGTKPTGIPSRADPRADPQFADIAASPLRSFTAAQSPTDIHEGDYSIAVREYEREQQAISDAAYSAKSARDGFIGLLPLAMVVLLISLLPWRRITQRAKRDGGAIAHQAATFGAKGRDVWRERTSPSPIIGRHGLSSYSVADELLKWTKLRDEGVVSEAEFEGARAKLLSKPERGASQ